MAYIDIIETDQAKGELKALYDQAEPRAGRVHNILKIMSRSPRALKASMELYTGTMFGPSELSRAQREMLAVVVSVCSSVDAFLALGFAAQITPGALLAFLLLGPVVDLKLAGLFTVLMRPRAILITAIGASLGVLLIGQWINLWLL